MSEKKNIMNSIKALESAIQKNVTRKHALLRGKKVTPSIMREDELNKVILKKENQLKKANQKLKEFDRV